MGSGLSSGGRKPTLLRLNAEKFCVFGVAVGVKDVELAMSDLNGQIRYRETFVPGTTPEEFFGVVGQKINEIVDTQRNRNLHYEGVGVSIPGLVDFSTGEILFAPNLGWRHVKVEPYLKLRTPVPVYIDNDANAAALAESWYDASANPSDNLALVLVSDGIGVGLIIHDEVYRGVNGTAGEFGHMVVDIDGEPCRCGNSGCWEVYASDHAMLSKYFGNGQAAGSRTSRRKEARGSFPISVSDLINLALSGDQKAVSAVEEWAAYLGIGLGNVLAGLSPREIVISGQLTRAWDLIERPILKALSRNIQEGIAAVKVRPSRLGGDGALHGAIVLAISRRFSLGRTAQLAS